MERNREESLKAKEIAELKFATQDFATAKKFAQKAFHLYPDLENIHQMLSVIDVHIAAQVQICRDEKDWYAILQVEPTADDASIRRQYKKLALFLHPDKNKSIGAESAFKLIGEAFQVLCDKTKRLVHDAKRGLAGKAGSTKRSYGTWNAQQHGQHESGAHSSASKEQQWKQHQQQQQQHHHQSFHQAFTFWTACPSCQMRYQYYRTYENQNLLCPHCRRPFIAKELSHLQRNNVTHGWPPPKFEHGGYYSPENHGTATHTSINGFTSGMSRSADVLHRYSWFSDQFTTASASKNGSAYSTSYFSEAAYQEAVRTQRAFALFKEELKRKKEMEKELARKETERQKKAKISQETHEKAQKHAAKAFAKERKRKGKKYESSVSSSSGEDEEDWEKVAAGQERVNLKGFPRRSSRSTKSTIYMADMSDDELRNAFASKRAGTDDVSGVVVGEDLERSQMKASLAKLARKLISEKLKEFHQQKNMDFSGKTTGVPSAHGVQKGPPLTKPRSNCQGSSRKEKQSSLKKSNTYTVPDADFHNFDKGREEKDIEAGQIWALYDEEDGMPRYYMKVKEVVTRSPFKVSISWLELRKLSERQRELQDKGFSLTCGEFRSSFSQIMTSVNSFSHLMKCEKGAKGIYKIFPLKGQVWAVYKDWEIWQPLVKLKYSMVEILSDCTEETGVSVMLLDKVERFKTLFQLSKGESMQIPFSELLRFSHQVPGHKLGGDEVPSIPEGCWELDPASVPLSLIYSDASP